MIQAENFVVQVSSGTSGRQPRVVRRSLDDIASLHDIILRAWLQLFPAPPRRVALLGGISHGQVARKFQLAQTRFESFSLNERDRLSELDPEFVSGYPSLIRELLEDSRLSLPSLKAIKLGGERIFSADLRKIQRRFPDLPVIEQLGCTEMPAVAMGLYRRAVDRRRLVPQTHRYTFRREFHVDWQPLVVRDRFPGTPFPDFYDTGDEVRWEGSHIVDVRRREEPDHPFFPHAESLLMRGCTNVQFDLALGELHYDGEVTLPGSLQVGDRQYEIRRRTPGRLPSNKLPLVVGLSPFVDELVR